MKASEVISRLAELMEKHGDLEVALYADHEPAEYIDYNSESWVMSRDNNIITPAFEFNGYGDLGKGAA